MILQVSFYTKSDAFLSKCKFNSKSLASSLKISGCATSCTRSVACVLVNISVLEKDIHNADSVATAKLQLISAVLVKRWVFMATNYDFPSTIVCSNMYVKMPQKDCRIC